MLCIAFRYEKSSEYEKDKRIRNITTSSKPRNNREVKEHVEDKENQRNMTIQNRSRNALININGTEPSAKPPQSPKSKVKSREITKTEKQVEPTVATSKITRVTKTVEEEVVVEKPTPRKSWREKVAEKELSEKKKNKNDEDEEEKLKARAAAKSIRQKIEAQLDEPAENSVKIPTSSNDAPLAIESKSNVDEEKKPEGTEEKEDATPEEEDVHGTKKMKADFDAKMIALEAEMSAGRSKLSKLRERIRKAKGVVKEADAALEDSKKS